MYPSTEDPLALNNALLPRNIFALHDGDPKLPIYIAVRGFVFDVSRDREVFGRGGPLNECAGREISRAIALGPPPSNNPPARCVLTLCEGVEWKHLGLNVHVSGQLKSHRTCEKAGLTPADLLSSHTCFPSDE
eukprot:1144331-Pelagomonas_calceolata.AAC.5